MTEWCETHDGLWAKLWEVLDLGVADGTHPARLPSFATVSAQAWPEVRTVVLRSADKGKRQITVHTDIHSDKVDSLRAHPRAALHIWEPETALQIRLQAEVRIACGEETRVLWERIPDHAQQSYGVQPAPGTPIANALDYQKTPDPATFAVLTCDLVHIDAVHLGPNHRRASFSRARGWQGQWLSP